MTAIVASSTNRRLVVDHISEPTCCSVGFTVCHCIRCMIFSWSLFGRDNFAHSSHAQFTTSFLRKTQSLCGFLSGNLRYTFHLQKRTCCWLNLNITISSTNAIFSLFTILELVLDRVWTDHKKIDGFWAKQNDREIDLALFSDIIRHLFLFFVWAQVIHSSGLCVRRVVKLSIQEFDLESKGASVDYICSRLFRRCLSVYTIMQNVSIIRKTQKRFSEMEEKFSKELVDEISIKLAVYRLYPKNLTLLVLFKPSSINKCS